MDRAIFGAVLYGNMSGKANYQMAMEILTDHWGCGTSAGDPPLRTGRREPGFCCCHGQKPATRQGTHSAWCLSVISNSDLAKILYCIIFWQFNFSFAILK
jgi:hypothetical protein